MVHVTGREDATWQGQVTWLDERETRSFRSMLELIKLMDAAMEEDMPWWAYRRRYGQERSSERGRSKI